VAEAVVIINQLILLQQLQEVKQEALAEVQVA
jgi:hypothetical protein